MPSRFTAVGQRKGFKKYTSEELKELVEGLAGAEAEKEAALGGIMKVGVCGGAAMLTNQLLLGEPLHTHLSPHPRHHRPSPTTPLSPHFHPLIPHPFLIQALVVKFVGGRARWAWAVDAIAQLDALMSLATHALNSGELSEPISFEVSTLEPLSIGSILIHKCALGLRSGVTAVFTHVCFITALCHSATCCVTTFTFLCHAAPCCAVLCRGVHVPPPAGGAFRRGQGEQRPSV